MNPINLIPHDIRQSQVLRVRLFRWSMVLGLSAGVALAPYLVVRSQAARTARLQEQLDRLDHEAASLRGSLRVATTRAQQARSEVERSRALRGKRSWSGMFALIASHLPGDCWLQMVSTDPETPAAGYNRVASSAMSPQANGTAAPVPETVTIEAPRKLRLVGSSTNDAQPLVFVENLMNSGVFSRVALQKALRSPASENNDHASYQFEVLCEW